MSTASRWYAYLVCLVSVISILWAIIALLRQVLTPGMGFSLDALALNTSIIVIGLPIYLGHWIWIRRMSSLNEEGRASIVSRLYLYVILAVLICPFLANAYDVLSVLLSRLTGYAQTGSADLTTSLVHDFSAIGVISVFWIFHRLVLEGDARVTTTAGALAVIRQLYLTLLTTAGLFMTALALINLIEWLLWQFPVQNNTVTSQWTDNVALLIVGGTLAYFSWSQMQRLFRSGQEDDEKSFLRKLFLYLVIFISTLIVVTDLAVLFSLLLQRLLHLPPSDLQRPIAILFVVGPIWLYHALVLREDAQQVGDAPLQADIRRLYWYLVATIGLAAFLVGLSGLIGLLIGLFDVTAFGDAQRSQLAWSVSAIIAGIVVWAIPWRMTQQIAESDTVAGMLERDATVRRIYLYFFLFVAAITVLASLVYIAYRIFSLVLGSGDHAHVTSDISQAVANTLIGAGLWAYHYSVLRSDAKSRNEAFTKARVLVIDLDHQFGQNAITQLQHDMPGLVPVLIDRNDIDAEANEAQQAMPIAERIADSQIIIGPWTITSPGTADGLVTHDIAAAIQQSSAQKILVPIIVPGYCWVGTDRYRHDMILRQLSQMTRNAIEGRPMTCSRPWGAGAIIGLVIAILIALILLAIPLLYFLMHNMTF